MKKIILIFCLVPLLNYSQTFRKDIVEPLTIQNNKSEETDLTDKRNIKQIEITYYGGGGLSSFYELDSISRINKHLTHITKIDYDNKGNVISHYDDYILFQEVRQFEYDSSNKLIKMIKSKWAYKEQEYSQIEIFDHNDSIITRYGYYKNDPERISYRLKYYINKRQLIYKKEEFSDDEDIGLKSTYKYNKDNLINFTNSNEVKYKYDTNKNLIRKEILEINNDKPILFYKYYYNDEQQLVEEQYFLEGELENKNEYEYKNNLVSKEVVYFGEKREFYWLYYYDNHGNWIRRERYHNPPRPKRDNTDWLTEITLRRIKYK